MVRQLPFEEWSRLAAFPPFDVVGLPTNPDHWRLIVAEDEAGEIVGFCGLFTAVHWEPWWVREDYRRHPGVLRGLINESFAVLHASQVEAVFAVVADELIEQQHLVERFGFQPAPGQLFILQVPQPATQEP